MRSIKGAQSEETIEGQNMSSLPEGRERHVTGNVKDFTLSGVSSHWRVLSKGVT